MTGAHFFFFGWKQCANNRQRESSFIVRREEQNCIILRTSTGRFYNFVVDKIVLWAEFDEIRYMSCFYVSKCKYQFFSLLLGSIWITWAVGVSDLNEMPSFESLTIFFCRKIYEANPLYRAILSNSHSSY